MRVNTEFKEVKGVGRIPVDWEVKKLQEIIESTELGTNSLGSEDNKGFPMLKMGNLTKGGFNFDKLEKIKYTENESNEKYFLKEGDFLFNTRNTLELVGKSAAWRCKVPQAIFNSNIMRIKFNENINSFYMSYYFENNIGWSRLKRIAIGTTSVAAIYTKDLYNVKVTIPQLREQEKIAQIIYNVDMNIEKTEEVIAKYKQVKKGLMDDLLTGKVRIKDGKRFRETRFKDVNGVGKIPWDWEVKALGEYIKECKSGLSRQIKSEDIGIPVMISGNIQDGKLDTSELKYWYRNDPQGADVDSYILKDNDILLCFINSLQQIGKVCLFKNIGRDSIYTTNLFRIQSKNDVLPEFLYYLLSGKCVQNEIKNITKPAVNQASFTKADFLNIKVPYLSYEEQVYIGNTLSKQDKLILKEEEYLEKLKRLKVGLMEDLLTGKVRVNLD